MISLFDLWWVSPQCFTFIKEKDGKAVDYPECEYKGAPWGKEYVVYDVIATSYPMYKHVLEVKIHRKEDAHEA